LGLPPAVAGAGALSGPSMAPKPPTPAGQAGSSFLDEWLTKRKGMAPGQPMARASSAPGASPPAYATTPFATSSNVASPTVAKSQPAPASTELAKPELGEFKIRRDDNNAAGGMTDEGQTIHIDKDGNLSYGQ